MILFRVIKTYRQRESIWDITVTPVHSGVSRIGISLCHHAGNFTSFSYAGIPSSSSRTSDATGSCINIATGSCIYITAGSCINVTAGSRVNVTTGTNVRVATSSNVSAVYGERDTNRQASRSVYSFRTWRLLTFLGCVIAWIVRSSFDRGDPLFDL